MPVRFKPILTGLIAVVLLAVAGCGSDDTTDTSSEDPPAASIRGPGSGQLGTSPTTTAMSEADRLHPRVRMQTSMGPITLELDRETAQQTVDNFISYVQSGHYDQTIFHQVIKGDTSIVIGGAYTGELVEKETLAGAYPIFSEAENAKSNTRGTIAMARQADAIDSATCHFFINLTDNEVLDHKDKTPAGFGYCVFGRITEGMEVADKVGAVEVHDTGEFDSIPVKTVMIQSMEILR
ncbi:MAG: peptidylprolyl isomerase [Thermoguttaceae bacterium]